MFWKHKPETLAFKVTRILAIMIYYYIYYIIIPHTIFIKSFQKHTRRYTPGTIYLRIYQIIYNQDIASQEQLLYLVRT